MQLVQLWLDAQAFAQRVREAQEALEHRPVDALDHRTRAAREEAQAQRHALCRAAVQRPARRPAVPSRTEGDQLGVEAVFGEHQFLRAWFARGDLASRVVETQKIAWQAQHEMIKWSSGSVCAMYRARELASA